jgi:hypothetical protein
MGAGDGHAAESGERMLNRFSTRGIRLLTVTATVVALAATAGATGASGAVSRMLAGPGHPQTASVVAKQQPGAVRAVAPVVPPPPWSGQLPPGVVYPIYSDIGNCYYQGVNLRSTIYKKCNPTGLGWYNPLDECFWKKEVPQPPPGAAVWLGLSVAVGNIYDVSCLKADFTLTPVKATFSSKIPPGNGDYTSLTDLRGLAVAAAASVVVTGILAPTMATDPPAAATATDAQTADRDHSTAGLVGLPTWFWSSTSLLTIGPIVLTVNLLGLLTVNASLLGQRLEWSTGDGHTVVCQKVGTPYTSVMASSPPPCGYTYTRPGTYAVSARSVWFLGFTVLLPPVTGTVLVVRSATPRYLKIDELQVVTQ